MTASCYNALLILVFSGILIIAAVVPCRGEAVVDTNGEEVVLVNGSGFFLFWLYWIRYLDMATGSLGYLSPVPANGSRCQNYVLLDQSERRPTVFFPTSASNNTAVMQLGELYEYQFFQFDTVDCNTPGVWALGETTGTNRLFRPIIAGQESGSYTRQSWFAVRSTGKKGQYLLAGCLCVDCGVPCPDLGSYASSYQVDGSRVLGVGTQTGVIVQFEKIYTPYDVAEQ